MAARPAHTTLAKFSDRGWLVAGEDGAVAVILVWAVVGLVCGVPCGGLAQMLLRTQHLTWRAWAVSALITSGLFAVLAWRLGSGVDLWAYSYLVAVLTVLAVVDLTELRLPGEAIWPSYLIVSSIFVADSISEARHDALLRSLAGMAILAAGHLVLALATGGLGAGDVKLAGLLGLALGWSSWTALVAGTFLGWLFAALARAALRSSGHMDRDAPMPMGPYLALGVVTSLALSPSWA